MKKINILKERREFDRIIKEVKPYKYKYYLIFLERKDVDNYKFGLSVGKKIGNAVVRNKIKRQLKSIIDKKVYKNDFKCIIIVLKGILSKSFSEREIDLNCAFKNLNIYKGELDEKN